MNEPEGSRERIRTFVRRRRAFFAAHAAATAALVCLALALGAVCIDVFVMFPVWVRAGAFVLLLLTVLTGLMRGFVLRSLRFDASAAVREIEHGCTNLGQMLRTSRETEDAEAAAESGFSPALARALADQAARELAKTDVTRLIPWRKIGRMCAGLALLALAFAAAALVWHDFRLGLQRLVLPTANLTFTRVAARSSSDRFERGETIDIRARVSGRQVTAAQVHLREDGGTWEVLDAVPEGPGKFSARLGGRARSYVCYVKAGDGRSALMHARFIDPPEIEHVQTAVFYPDYTGIAPQTFDDGNIVALEGSRVVVSFRLNHALREGRLVIRPREYAPIELGNAVATATFVAVAGDREYFLQGRDAEDLPLRRRVYRVRGLEDRLPQVRILEPAADIQVTKLTEIPVQVRVTDDYGIAELGIVLRLDDTETTLKAVHTGTDIVSTWAESTVLMLEHFPVDIRSNLKLYAHARDRKPDRDARAVSDLRAIDIRPLRIEYRMMPAAAPEALTAASKLEQQQNLDALENTIARQREVVSDTFKLKEERTQDASALQDLAAKQDELARETQRLQDRMLDLPVPAAPDLLSQAADLMEKAVRNLRRGETPEAFAREDQALANLLDTRREMAAQLRAQQERQAASRPQPPETADLTTLAAEAERLAREEHDIRAQAAAARLPAPSETAGQSETGAPQAAAETAPAPPAPHENGRAQHAPAARQQQAVADAETLLRHIRTHPEATPLAERRLADTTQRMQEAGQALARDSIEPAVSALREAEHGLTRLAEHLRGLAPGDIQQTLESAAAKAANAAQRLQPLPAPPASEHTQTGTHRPPPADSASTIPPDATPPPPEAGPATGPESPAAAAGAAAVRAPPAELRAGPDSRERERIAEDAETVDDWTRQLAARPEPGLERTRERLREMREELGLAGLADQVRDARNQRDRGRATAADRADTEAAQRLRELADGLTRERNRLVQDRLQRLAATETETNALRQQIAAAAEPQQAPAARPDKAQTQSRAGAGQGGEDNTPERLQDLAAELRDLNDKPLEKLGTKLAAEVAALNVSGRSRPGGQPIPTSVAEDTLTPAARRLRTLIDAIVQQEMLLHRDARVPAKYTRLVEQYFRALSDDLRE